MACGTDDLLLITSCCNFASGLKSMKLIRYIQPGKPAQNAYVEWYNRTVRHEWLDLTIFESVEHAQETATQWPWRYNARRPNTAIGGMTPYQKLAMVA